jgi:hypothetical protein
MTYLFKRSVLDRLARVEQSAERQVRAGEFTRSRRRRARRDRSAVARLRRDGAQPSGTIPTGWRRWCASAPRQLERLAHAIR